MLNRITAITPVPLAGLGLSIASLANLLSDYSIIIYNLLMIIAIGIIIIISTTFIVDSRRIKDDLESPIVFGVLPTYYMCLMLISGFIMHFNYYIALLLFLVAISANIITVFVFSKKFLFKFNIKNVYPTWFVLYVGYLVACIVAPSFGLILFSKVLFYAGFVSYIFVLGLVSYRVLKIKQIPEPALPTLAIYTAPANLSIVACLSTFKEDSNILILLFLLMISVACYLFVLSILPTILKLKFYPSFAALTFPFVISATSYKKIGIFFKVDNTFIYQIVCTATTIIAIFVVLLVFLLYVRYYVTNLKEQSVLAYKNL